MKTMYGLLSAAVLACGAVGCRTAAPNANVAGSVAPASQATLVVKNDNFADMDVYLLSGGAVSKHVGTVPGQSSAVFPLDGSYVGMPNLRLAARPVIGRGVARSDRIWVQPGQSVTFDIEPNLALSFAQVR